MRVKSPRWSNNLHLNITTRDRNLVGRLRVRIFTLVGYYLPGYKGGGPIRSIANLADHLGDSIDFYVYCLDRDMGDKEPYPGVVPDQWVPLGRTRVFHATDGPWAIGKLKREIQRVAPHYVYLNSFFSPWCFRYLLLRRFGLTPRVPVVLAPRGEFSPGALAIGWRKKRLFLFFAQGLCGLYRGLRWQVSSTRELSEVQAILGPDHDYRVAPNLPPRIDHLPTDPPAKPNKRSGHLRLVFCSRLSPKKNLTYLFPLLNQVRGTVELEIIGAPDQPGYEKDLQQAAGQIDSHIQTQFIGPLPHDRILSRLAGSHVFVLPTLGENYGHAILEAMLAGCPVLISDRTPWQDLAALQVGWEIPLEDPARWVAILQSLIDMDNERFQEMSRSAFGYARNYCAHPPVAENLALFTP